MILQLQKANKGSRNLTMKMPIITVNVIRSAETMPEDRVCLATFPYLLPKKEATIQPTGSESVAGTTVVLTSFT